jgi:hypothetical protein
MNLIDRVVSALANARGMRRGAPEIVNVLSMLSDKVLEEFRDDARAVLQCLGITEDNTVDFPSFHGSTGMEPMTYENVIAARREIEEKLAGYGWGPKKIAEHIWRLHRNLAPSETLEQFADLVRKDLNVIFGELEEAEDAQRAGRMAEKILRKRLMEQYEAAWTNARDGTLSEPYRASQAKLALELTDKLAKLDHIDLDGLSKRAPEKRRTRVIVGAGGVPRTEGDDNRDTN